MNNDSFVSGSTKEEKYIFLVAQIKSLIDSETDNIANFSNITSAIKYGMNFFWVGFYFVKENQLVLGPFQGPIACTRINKGKGVCGTCWKKKETIIVDDVDSFPGHIACSSFSKSEIVVPCLDKKGEVIFVLDVDDDKYSAFDDTDKKYLSQIVKLMLP